MNRRKFLLGSALAAIASTVRPKRDPTPSVASTMTFAQAKRARPVWKKDADPRDWCVLVDQLGPELTIDQVRQEVADATTSRPGGYSYRGHGLYAAWPNGTDPSCRGVIYDLQFVDTPAGHRPRLLRYPCAGVVKGESVLTEGFKHCPEIIDL